MARKDVSGDILCRHDYVRAVYRALLQEFPERDVVDFFARHPLAPGGPALPPTEVFRLLWKEKGQVPQSWDYAIDSALEPFLIERGHDYPAFIRELTWRNNRGSYFPGKVLLSWFYPLVERAFDSLDARDIVFAFMTPYLENYMPGTVMRRVKKVAAGEWVESYVQYRLAPGLPPLEDWDFGIVGGEQIKISPCILGLPPLEEFRLVMDIRSPERIVWRREEEPRLDARGFHLGGRRIGSWTTLGEFLAGYGLAPDPLDRGDHKVVVLEEDYACPLRRRTVLHRGCAYLGPHYLGQARHRKIRHTPKFILQHMVEDGAAEERDLDAALQARHERVLALCGGKLEFVYHRQDESVTCNGSRLVRSVPAKILRDMLQAYTTTGKSEFEYHDFKRDEEISLGRKRFGLDIRVARLLEAVNQRCPGLRLEKSGRGKIRLRAEAEIGFREDG